MDGHFCNYEVIRNITYCTTKTKKQDLEHKYKTDLYIPQQNSDYEETGLAQDERKRIKPPVAIFVHGGGWRRGDKDAWKHFVCEDINLLVACISRFYSLYGNVGAAMARRGIPCAVMSYPLTRLHSRWIFLELFSSYICSVLFLGALFGIFAVFGISLATLFSNDLLYQILHTPHSLPVPVLSRTEVLLLHLLTSDMFILALISGQYHRYRLGYRSVIFIWISVFLLIASGHFINISTSVHLLISFGYTFIVSQGILAFSNLARKPATPKEQIDALVHCIKEVKQYARKTDLFDEDSIFLMGHSAGGHLCSLTTLCGKQLLEAGIDSTDIKGVIAISAVLDIENLNKRPISQLYLHPAFGTDKDLWQSLSPIHKIKLGPQHIPHFLVVTAERDFHLRKEASDFCDEVARKNGRLKSVMIPRTNHASIIFYFDSYINNLNLANICHKFILETMLYVS